MSQQPFNHQHDPPRIRRKTIVDEKGVPRECVNADDLDTIQVTDMLPHDAKEGIKGTEKLIRETDNLIETMYKQVELLRKGWPILYKDIKDANEDLRTVRMSISTESKQIVQALQDIRNFFMDQNYEKQIHALEEFIVLCERLQTLKNSGFLDAVVDTILKFSPPK